MKNLEAPALGALQLHVALISHVLKAATTGLPRGEESLRVAFKARKQNKEINSLKEISHFKKDLWILVGRVA